MGVSSFWPLLFLILVLVIILLYILKQEAVEYKFSSTLLWQEVYRNMEATKPWEKLRKNLLMALQILSVIFFVLVLMGPWLKSLGKDSGMLILVMDNSASMQTMYDDKDTRLDMAKKAAVDYVDSAPSGTSFFLITVGKEAVLKLSGGSDKLEVKNRIHQVEQTDFAGDASLALGLVQSVAAQSEDAQIIIFTDTAFDGGGLPAMVENLYSKVANAALDGVSAVYKDDELLVLVSGENFGDTDVDGEVNLYGITEDGKEQMLDISPITIPAGETVSVYLREDPDKLSGMVALKAELNEEDALLSDNKVYCVLENAKDRNILLLSKSNLFLEKAFSILPNTNLYRTTETDLSQTRDTYDLYIFDGILPDKLPDSGNFLFINCEEEAITGKCGKVEGKRLTFVDSDVTSNLTDHKVGVNKSLTYEVPSYARPYLVCGEECTGFYGIYGGHKVVTLGFDLHQTDLGLQTDFPVLISQLSDYLLQGSLVEKNSYVIGSSAPIYPNVKGADLTFAYPDGKKDVLSISEMGSFLSLDQLGIYTIRQEVEEQELSGRMAVNFPKTESNVTSVDQMLDKEGAMTLTVHKGALPLRNYLLVILLLLMAGEWIVYLRMQ